MTDTIETRMKFYRSIALIEHIAVSVYARNPGTVDHMKDRMLREMLGTLNDHMIELPSSKRMLYTNVIWTDNLKKPALHDDINEWTYHRRRVEGRIDIYEVVT